MRSTSTTKSDDRGSAARKREPAWGTSDDPLVARYMAEVNRFPLLSLEDERGLADRYAETRDVRYAQRLVNANLRFVVKIAHEFRGYNVPFLDLVQEGNLGLMAGVRRFEPGRGYRLVSYAVWWIRAYMRVYAMHNWSLVKVGTTQAQRRLFFSLRAARASAEAADGAGEPVTNAALARHLGVREGELDTMSLRLAGRDTSLDQRVGDDGHQTRLDQLVASAPDVEELVAAREVGVLLRRGLHEIAPQVTEKQAYILKHRLGVERPQTLQQIGRHLRVSRERVRQIEGALLEKVRARLQARGLYAAA